MIALIYFSKGKNFLFLIQLFCKVYILFRYQDSVKAHKPLKQVNCLPVVIIPGVEGDDNLPVPSLTQSDAVAVVGILEE